MFTRVRYGNDKEIDDVSFVVFFVCVCHFVSKQVYASALVGPTHEKTKATSLMSLLLPYQTRVKKSGPNS